jgi:hypothetical protein
MRELDPATEDDMIAAFVRAELDSPVNPNVRIVLGRDRIDEAMVRCPDFRNTEQNRIRRQILAEVRGYPDRFLFTGFPANTVGWMTAELSLDDLRSLLYLGQKTWTDLSGPSRKGSDAATRLASPALMISGTEGARNNARLILELAATLRKGKAPTELDPLIIVAKGKDSDHVVLEGCKRLTAMLLTPDLLPSELRAIVGYSPQMDSWYWYEARSA